MSFDYLTVYRQFILLRDGIIADDRDEKYKCIDKFNTMFNSTP